MKKKMSLLFFAILSFQNVYSQDKKNYSKQMQQAILLYEEGKTTDAMDRFMDILVSGTPEEKVIASEYISKITQGIGPQTKSDKTTSKTSVIITEPKKEKQSPYIQQTNMEQNQVRQQEEDIISNKVDNIIKDLRIKFLYLLNNTNTVKLYMNEGNEKPNFALIKEDKIFNNDMTFNTKGAEDLKNLAGFIATIDKIVVTIFPNGSITGNLKVANVRKATILHKYFIDMGLSPSKIKLDLLGSQIQANKISSKIDDLDGILLAFDYLKEPELFLNDMQSPRVSLFLYPNSIDISKNDVSIVDFAVIAGKEPISTWKLLLNRKVGQALYTIQKIENTVPLHSKILFNGKEKLIGSPYEPGEYEFYLEASDVRGNTVFTKKTIYLITTKNTLKENQINNQENKSQSKVLTGMQNKKSVFYKIYFKPNTFNITENSKKKLDLFVKDYKNFSNARIVIVGFASSKEKKPKTTAWKRATVVKNILLKNYKIKSSAIEIETKVTDIEKKIVELKIK